MGALLAVLLPLIPTLVQGVEAAFVKSKSGTDKMDAVVSSLRVITDKLIATGQAAVPAVTDDALRGVVETVFQQLKTSGQLTLQPTAGPFYILQGTVTPLQIGK